MRYFTRAFNGSPMYDATGALIESTPITSYMHYIATDEPAILKTMDKFLKTGIGGIAEVSAAELEDVKKKLGNLKPFTPDILGGPRVAPDTITQSVKPAAAVVEVGDTMLPLAEEVKASHVAQKAAATKPKESPPPTPPVVGHRKSPSAMP